MCAEAELWRQAREWQPSEFNVHVRRLTACEKLAVDARYWAVTTGAATGADSSFIWATGIEDTFVPQVRRGNRALDEYELMGHYDHWREDLALVSRLGVGAFRWGIPWYRVEPERGRFDWRWIDQALPYLVRDLGVNPIVDLMHYGCPSWLERGFADELYPEAVSEYAAAFAERYHSLVSWYTPLNEPAVTGLMCGRRGVWPPYLRGDRGFVKVLVQVALGMQRTIEAIKQVDEAAVIVHVEATGMVYTEREELQSVAVEAREKAFLSLDLFMGRVTAEHSQFSWLIGLGVSLHDLAALERGRQEFDILGLNYYPQWGTKELHLDRRGLLRARTGVHDGSNFLDLIRLYFDRYACPLMITETSAHGSDDVRSAWLGRSLAAIKQARSLGIPVRGYTWFPLFTMIDWKYRTGNSPMEDYLLELGLFRWNRDHGPRWIPSPLVREFERCVAEAGAKVGKLQTRRPTSSQGPAAVKAHGS